MVPKIRTRRPDVVVHVLAAAKQVLQNVGVLPGVSEDLTPHPLLGHPGALAVAQPGASSAGSGRSRRHPDNAGIGWARVPALDG
jgi:thiazole synthase ThiGH ThiG subunit